MWPADEIMPCVIELRSISEYHCTAFIKHNRIYLFPAPLQPPLPAQEVAAAVSAPVGAGSSTNFDGSLLQRMRVLAPTLRVRLDRRRGGRRAGGGPPAAAYAGPLVHGATEDSIP